MPFPENLQGVLESMKFCPKCGGPLENMNDEENPTNKMLTCKTDVIFVMWECDGDYDYWTISVETREVRVQSVKLGDPAW